MYNAVIFVCLIITDPFTDLAQTLIGELNIISEMFLAWLETCRISGLLQRKYYLRAALGSQYHSLSKQGLPGNILKVKL